MGTHIWKCTVFYQNAKMMNVVTEQALVAKTALWPIPFSFICSLLVKDLSFNLFI